MPGGSYRDFPEFVRKPGGNPFYIRGHREDRHSPGETALQASILSTLSYILSVTEVYCGLCI